MSVIQDTLFDESDLVTSILSSFYILDYGIVTQVNVDESINVRHAKKTTMLDGQELPETITKNIEVLTLSFAGLALKCEVKPNDKVLLLGLKDYIKSTKDVKDAETNSVFFHYTRECLKAIPLCVFNPSAKITIQTKDGDLQFVSEKLHVTTNAETEIKADSLKVTTNDKIELNGNSKQFVTFAELDTALKQFLQALNAHTHSGGNQGAPTGPVIIPLQLDISSAKTQTVVTGG